MKREHVQQTSVLIERDSSSRESWEGKYNLKYLYNLFHNYDKDNWLYVIMPFFKQTSQNKVYLKKIIVGTSNKCRPLTANLHIPGTKRHLVQDAYYEK